MGDHAVVLDGDPMGDDLAHSELAWPLGGHDDHRSDRDARLHAPRENGKGAIPTGSDSRADIRAGFDAGGDDYIVKPFDAEKLSSRVRAILRRAGHAVRQVWEIDGLVVDSGARMVTRNGNPISLTAIEFDLLEVLLRSRSHVVSKQLLLNRVWGYDGEQRDHHLVEVHLSSLRGKLEAHGNRLIHTVHGAGYVLRPPG